jgi:glycosyltransferase involved in cell wall biosynthesis
MVRRVLMIAFHFPPLRGSSGIQRTLKFARYLPDNGWLPMVLSASPRAYANTGDDQLAEIPPEIEVARPFCLDTSRHLAIRGSYLSWMALPDRMVSWWLGAVPRGLAMVWRRRPQVIWSTYPIATAHLIGLTLHKLTGLPWVVDMRDPMVDATYPSRPSTRSAYKWIERKAILHCSRVVCTTPGTIEIYRKRYPTLPPEHFCLIENGFDEENFIDAEALKRQPVSADHPLTLVHSGVIYPSERDPNSMFAAIAELQREGELTPANFRLVLRATGHDDYLRTLLQRYGIEALVTLAPHVAYREALSEMLNADGLLILQASNCNHQIPAKLYEYLRAQRPVLALTDPVGDTAKTLRAAGIDTIAALDSRSDIHAALRRFLALVRVGQAPLASDAVVASNQRRARAKELAQLLNSLVSPSSESPP